jgi:hypothetical protein
MCIKPGMVQSVKTLQSASFAAFPGLPLALLLVLVSSVVSVELEGY